MNLTNHVVKQGDSFWSIATSHNISLARLIAANPQVTNPALIYPGQVIRIPGALTIPIPTWPEQPAPTQPSQPAPTQPSQPVPIQPLQSSAAANNSDFAMQVIQLVNEQRADSGLPPMTANAALMDLALLKSEDMNKNNYFSHTSPTFGTPFDLLSVEGISYSAAGENIARGQQTPSSVMTAWMNSPGHRMNILSDRFTETGVGFVNFGTPIWTQLFLCP